MATGNEVEKLYNLNGINSWQNSQVCTPANTPETITVPLVSEDAIDTDMSDKVVTKTKTAEQTKENEEKKSWLQKAWGAVKTTANNIAEGAEQLYKQGVIKVAELTDSETVLEYAHSFEDLSDGNLERLADVDIESELQNFRQKAGEVISRIKDIHTQLEVAKRHTKEGDDDVRIGYAKNISKMNSKNQGEIANSIAANSIGEEPVSTLITEIKNCAVPYQAEIVNQTTLGIEANQNYNDETKSNLGCQTAREIINLDKSQQADAYTYTANNLHRHEDVVNEVVNQVANYAEEEVRQQAMSNLQQSKYDNVKQSFTKDNIEQVQKIYREEHGIKTPETIKEEPEIKKETTSEAIQKQAETRPIQDNTTQPTTQNTETKKEQNNTKEKSKEYSTAKSSYNTSTNVTSAYQTTTYSNEVKTFKDCRNLNDLAEVMKKSSSNEVNKFFERLNETQKRNLFKKTTSPYIQTQMLKKGIVNYEEVSTNLLPEVKSKLDVLTLNNDIERALTLLT